MTQTLVVGASSHVDAVRGLDRGHSYVSYIDPKDEGAPGELVFVFDVRLLTDVPVPQNPATKNTLYSVTCAWK